MKIRIPITHFEEVTLSEENIRAVIYNYIYRHYGIPSDAYIKYVDKKDLFDSGDYLMHEVEYCSSHCWYEEEEIRKATEQDKFLVELIKEIRENGRKN